MQENEKDLKIMVTLRPDPRWSNGMTDAEVVDYLREQCSTYIASWLKH
jgi:hypothetical protein